ncbi:MAG: hypothetical protein ACKO7G_02130, partial [Gammaproteobacteria bacterium]
MSRAILIIAVTTAFASGSLSAAPPPKIPVATFFANPAVSQPSLSADGQTYALIISQGDTQVIATRAVGGDQTVPVAKVVDPAMRLSWLRWANADRILISGQFRDPLSTGVRARATRLFGVDRDGNNFGPLARKWPTFGPGNWSVQFQDSIIHWTPADPKTVLLSFQSPMEAHPEVMRMDVDTGALKRVQAAVNGIREWYADPEGQIRAGVASDGDRYQIWARSGPDEPLREVVDEKIFGATGPTFAGFHSDPRLIYVMAPDGGRQ